MSQRVQIIIRYLFVVISGTLLHFAYEYSNQNLFVGFFSPINESVWEHLKLIFFPMLLLTIWDYFSDPTKIKAIIPSRVAGIIAGFTFIIVIHYTVSGIIGKDIAWIDILIFLLAVAYAFLTEKKVSINKNYTNATSATIILLVLVILFVIFTITPPVLGIFISKAN